MQEPTWLDILRPRLAAMQGWDWSFATLIAIAVASAMTRVLVSWVWARHRRQQQLAIVRSVFTRWVDGLGQPFWTLSTASQLDAIARLREALVGDRIVVIDLLIAMRVQLETLALDGSVLEALDRLAAEWEEKTASAHQRRYRRVRALEKANPDTPRPTPDA